VGYISPISFGRTSISPSRAAIAVTDVGFTLLVSDQPCTLLLTLSFLSTARALPLVLSTGIGTFPHAPPSLNCTGGESTGGSDFMAHTPRVLSLNISITDVPNEAMLEDAACVERPLSFEVGNVSFENLWLRVGVVGDDGPAFSGYILTFLGFACDRAC